MEAKILGYPKPPRELWARHAGADPDHTPMPPPPPPCAEDEGPGASTTFGFFPTTETVRLAEPSVPQGPAREHVGMWACVCGHVGM